MNLQVRSVPEWLVKLLKPIWTCPVCKNGESEACRQTVLDRNEDYVCPHCTRIVKAKWFDGIRKA